MNALDTFEKHFGPAGKPLSQLIRPAIVAPRGRTLVWGDWSAIEARVLPWLADSPGATDVLDVFRASDADPDAPDIYMREAGNIRGKNPANVDSDERQEGKVAVLSLGFGGARGALQAMAVGYGLSLSDAEADRIVNLWRENNQWARDFWNQLWDAFRNCMESPGTTYTAGRCTFVFEPDFMRTVFMFLPDGRPIQYPSCRWGKRVVEDEFGNKEEREGFVYRRGDETRSIWYGTLAENATQGTAGSRLREALTVLSPAPQLDERGWEIEEITPGEVVGHTHDEVIMECDEDEQSIHDCALSLYGEMMRTPGWLSGCPMAAELTSNFYYTKAKGVGFDPLSASG